MTLAGLVALRKESVDRNHHVRQFACAGWVALRKESVDRNLNAVQIVIVIVKSLSARRAWIEIIDDLEPSSTRKLSLSARRAWIEITYVTRLPRAQVSSLSARRAWIEITAQTARNTSIAGRSPQGERG